MKPAKNHSIENEPHLKSRLQIQPVDEPLGFNASVKPLSQQQIGDVEYSVWDEPGVSLATSGTPPKDALTFGSWLDYHTQQWSQSKAWGAALVIGILAGPWALLNVILYGAVGQGAMANQIGLGVVVCFFGPLIQEISKIALPLWVVEKRPYFFTSWFQIFVCTLASATIFAAVFAIATMLIFDIKDGPAFFLLWIVYLFAHVFTATLSACGMEKIWRHAIYYRKPPKLEIGYRWFLTAFIVHAVLASVFFFYFLGKSLIT